jgi:hypothetical protein
MYGHMQIHGVPSRIKNYAFFLHSFYFDLFIIIIIIISSSSSSSSRGGGGGSSTDSVR